MSWIFLNDRSVLSENSSKLNASASLIDDDTLLVTGSLVLEIDFAAAGNAPCRLLHYETSKDWQRRFTIYLNADYSLSVETQQGCTQSYVHLADATPNISGIVKLIYSWDAPKRLGLLSLENSDSGSINQAVIQRPIPLPIGDAKKIVLDHTATKIDKRVLNIALSDKVETVGPAPSICAGALVETTDGSRPIENLKLGDMVVTHDHGPQPIRWIIKQELASLGRAAPVKLHAPFFDLTSDITVAQNQRVMISGIETEYNLGKDAVLIEAQNLVGYPGVSLLTDRLATTYYQLLFDNHECIHLSGTWADSLYVGQLALSPEIAVTTGLADVPNSVLPIHHAMVHPVLQNYESRALLETLTA